MKNTQSYVRPFFFSDDLEFLKMKKRCGSLADIFEPPRKGFLCSNGIFWNLLCLYNFFYSFCPHPPFSEYSQQKKFFDWSPYYSTTVHCLVTLLLVFRLVSVRKARKYSWWQQPGGHRAAHTVGPVDCPNSIFLDLDLDLDIAGQHTQWDQQPAFQHFSLLVWDLGG